MELTGRLAKTFLDNNVFVFVKTIAYGRVPKTPMVNGDGLYSTHDYYWITHSATRS
jgi:hypothetical protein